VRSRNRQREEVIGAHLLAQNYVLGCRVGALRATPIFVNGRFPGVFERCAAAVGGTLA
jgi:hypothetical protein